MEQKDLSVLSLKELRQMLEAITFNQKSEAQVEAKRVVGLREVNEGEKLVEANETSEIILGKVDSETVEKDEEKPNQQEIERVKDLEAEQQLKLQHFSTEEKFEEFVGDSEREQMKVERFSVGPAKPHVFRNVPYINVAARKSNKEMKKGRTVKRTQVRCWRYDKRRRDRWKKELKPSHVVTQRGVREASLCFDGRGWTSQASEEEKGFLFNITQQSIIGLRLFSAQPNYSQIRHLTEINRGALPTMVNSENTKRTEAKAAKRSRWVSKILPSLLNAYTTIRKEEDFGHDEAIGTEKTKNGTAVISTFSHLFDINTTRGGTSFHGIPEFMCFGLIEALFWDVLRKKGVIF